MSSRIAGLAVAAVAGLLLGIAGSDSLGARTGGTAPVGLGSSAADVLAADGPPARIDASDRSQDWAYPDSSGAVRLRYTINQGVVVFIHRR